MDGLLAHMFSLTAQPVAQPQFQTRVIYSCIYISGLSVHPVSFSLGFSTFDFFLKGEKSSWWIRGPVYVLVVFNDEPTLN